MLVTGGAGVIGQVLTAARPDGGFAVFDLPAADARDRGALTEAARGTEAIVHLAWDARKESHHNGRFAPENLVMAQNALEAAVAAGVPRVILASSVHADTFWPPPDARLEPDHTPIPASPYGASKVFMEALGRHFAAHRGLEVVAIRFGGVTPDDVRPEDPAERPAWLPHEDCVSLVDAALSEPLRAGPFALAVGVGDWPDRVHEYSDELARRPRRRR